MSDWTQQLEQALNPGDASVSVLDAEARAAARLLLSQASASEGTEALLQVLDTKYPVRDREKHLLLRPAYLRGRLLLQLEKTEEALHTLLPVCEKIEQGAQWHDLAELADEILETTPSVDAARYLAKALEAGGPEVVPEGSLARAASLFPDEPRICWLVAEAEERAGNEEHALALFSACLPALVESRNFEKVEEVFLRLEDREDVESVQAVLHACLALISIKKWQLAETYLEPLFPRIKSCGLAGEAWDQLLKLLPKTPVEAGIRRFLMEIAPEALPAVDGVLDLLGRSGLMDTKIKSESALRKLRQLLEFAPGYRVLHRTWGPGRIRAAESDALFIDFKDKPGHRMSLNIARTALKVVPPDDLRVLQMEKPDEVRKMVRSDKAGLAFLAIRELGGKATSQELRRRMTPDVITTSSWSTWWKDTRAQMQADERFDLSESFRQTYAISEPGVRSEEDHLLPRLDRRRGIRANLNLLHRFLGQHPQFTDRAVKMYTPVLTRWLRDEKTNPEAAVATCLLLDQWKRLELDDLDRSLRALLNSGVEAIAFADEGAQRRLTTRGLELKALRSNAILFALGSRYASIRDIALEELRRDPAKGSRLITDLLSSPEERPHTALTVILTTISKDTDRESFLPSPWRAAASLCQLVDRTGRDTLRAQVMRLFNPRSQLGEVLRDEPLPEDVYFLLGNTFKRWRESEQYLFPILEFLEEMGQVELVLSVRSERTDATNRMLISPAAEDGSFDGYYLTRATYSRLEAERNHMTHELKTTVAQALQSAREMGDLSENAEYDAAKEKQATYAARIQQIGDQLRQATLIENLSVPEGEIGPGSWVELRVQEGDGAPAGEMLSVWLLGEGDSRLGQEVVSCMAPAARPLLGRRVGDSVTLPMPDGTVVAEVVSLQRRLPEVEKATD